MFFARGLALSAIGILLGLPLNMGATRGLMKWLLTVVVILLVAAGAVILTGFLLPPDHRASTRATITAPRDDVWRTLLDVRAFPEWREDVEAVEILSADQGRFAWRERGAQGPITYEHVEVHAPERLVSRLTDESLPFGGTWTYELGEVPAGTEVTIIEHGTVRNPLFRFLSHFVFGHHSTQESFLRSLAARFGQEVELQRLR